MLIQEIFPERILLITLIAARKTTIIQRNELLDVVFLQREGL